RAALGALLRNQLVPRCELTLRIAPATVEKLSAPAAPFQHFAFLALRTRHSGLYRVSLEAFDSVAIGITRASEKFPEARPFKHHRLAALLADLIVGRPRGGLLDLDSALVLPP